MHGTGLFTPLEKTIWTFEWLDACKSNLSAKVITIKGKTEEFS